MAHDVIDLLDHFGWQKHVHLNGISMGGMIALELVSRWPSRFSSVVLTSTTPGGQIPPVVITFKQPHPSSIFFFLSSRPSRPFSDWSLPEIRPTSSPRSFPSSILLSGSLPNRPRSNMHRTRPTRTCPWPSIWPGWIAVDLRPWSATWVRWSLSLLTLCLRLDWKRSSRVGFDAWWWQVPGIIWWTQRIHIISVKDWDVNWSSLRAVVIFYLLKNPRDTIGWWITISVTAYLISIHFHFSIT